MRTHVLFAWRCIMYIASVPNRNSRPTILLREGKRQGKKIIKNTLLNLTHWPEDMVESLRRIIAGETLVSIHDIFSVTRSLPHGHVETILLALQKLKLGRLISSQPSRQKNIILALIVQRIIQPGSKLATTRLWHDSTLAKELNVEDVDEDDVYEAMDWLLKRKKRIENKLARRHLKDNAPVLYDVTSSYYEGHTCSLAFFGHSRDKKKGLPQIVYGLMTDAYGCPVSVDVYPGNTGDPSTVPRQVDKLRNRFQLERVILVGDRGLLTQTQIDNLIEFPQLGWISALKSKCIRKLIVSGDLQLSIFDRINIAEIISDDFPGERLIVCFNPLLAERRKTKREKLIQATSGALDKISAQVKRRTKKPLKKEEIALKAGKVIGRYKVAKHFHLSIDDNYFSWTKNEDSIKQEMAQDGIYIIRTSEKKEAIPTPDVVRHYKRLQEVERAFRCLKGADLEIRPIYHRIEERVICHIFLCFLAYYVEWHMRQVFAPLLYEEENREETRKKRDPVLPAKPTEEVKRKKKTHKTLEGFPLHSFRSLLSHLATCCQNWCKNIKIKSAPPIVLYTEKTPLQRKALELINHIVPSSP